MGLFDTKWIVEFEYSSGFFSSYKKDAIVVEASSDYDAKSKAKAVLKGKYSYVKIISAHKSGGKAEENKAKNLSELRSDDKPRPSNDYSTNSSHKKLSPEERSLLLEQIKQREEMKKQRNKLDLVEKKAKAVKKAAIYHIRMAIISGIISLTAFLLGWVPYWIYSFQAFASKTQLEMWIELGHSETDEIGQECAEAIIRHTQEANSVLWIPFAVLAVGFVVTILVFIMSRNKTQSKVDKVSEELKTIVKEYEDEYGEIGTLHNKY